MQRSSFQTRLASSVDGRRVAVGLSGGLDSVVLLHALVCGGAQVCAAHVDHGLRVDSADDAAFCADLAAQLGVPFASTAVQIKPGNSTQGRARNQRYAALVRLASELGADLLALGHHADDAWESMQLQAERGAGAIGAAGPRVWSSWWGFETVRPMLGERRAAIERYAAEAGLRWREDPSNHQLKYARARLRADPVALDPAQMALIRDRAAQLARDVHAVTARARALTEVEFDRAALAQQPDEVRARILLDAARALHGELSAPLVHELSEAVVDDNRSARSYCGRHVVAAVSSAVVSLVGTRGQGLRLLDQRRTPTLAVVAPMELPWFTHRVTVGHGAPNTAGFALATTDGVTLRGPRPGDRIVTAHGERRVVEVLAELEVPPAGRWCWPCLYRDDQCLAVADGAVAIDPIVLPRGQESGIFVGWERLVSTDFAVQTMNSRR